MYKTLIIGAGVFGVAIGEVIMTNGHEVSFLTNHPEYRNELLNGKFPNFPGVHLKHPQNVFTSYEMALKEQYDFLIIAVPSRAISEVWEKVCAHLTFPVTVINVAKGIREGSTWSHFFMENEYVQAYCALSGPSFAKEIVCHERTLVNLFSRDETTFIRCQNLLNTPFFRIQWLPASNEVVSTEISAIKNVIAIGLGIISRITNSKNTAAAMIVLAFQDLRRWLNHYHPNINPDLLQPYAIGDILLTASSPLSRNYRFGQRAAEIGFQNAVLENNETVEGLQMLRIMEQRQKHHPIQLGFFNVLIQIYRGEIPSDKFLDQIWSQI